MRATGEDYEWLSKKMTQLCRFFGTQVHRIPIIISKRHWLCQIEDRGEEKGMCIDMAPHEIKVKKKNTPKQFPGP